MEDRLATTSLSLNSSANERKGIVRFSLFRSRFDSIRATRERVGRTRKEETTEKGNGREREKERVWRMERKRERNGKREKEARGRFGAPGTHNYTLAHGESAKRSRRREAKLNTFQSAPSSWSADTARTRHEEFRSLIYSCSDPDWSSIGSTAPF